MSFVWNSNSRHSAVRSLYCQSFYSSARLLCLPACIPRLNALQCSRAGQLLPSPQALCLCVLSALLCCQTRRLVIQSGWRGVVLQIRPCAEGAPSQRRSICWLRLASRLSTQDIFFSPTSRPPPPRPTHPFPSISFCPPSNSPYLSSSLNYQNNILILLLSSLSPLLLILLSSSYLQQMLRQIPLLSSIRGCRYKWMFSLFAATRVNYIFFILRHSKDTRVKLLSLQPSLAPLCVL